MDQVVLFKLLMEARQGTSQVVSLIFGALEVVAFVGSPLEGFLAIDQVVQVSG